MHIYLKQKVFAIGDKYNFIDDTQNVLYKGKKPLFSITKMYLNNPSDEPLYFVKKKLISLMPTYRIYKDGIELYTIKQKFGLKAKFEIYDSEGNMLRVQGSFFAFNFTLFLGEKFIGAIDKKVFAFGDTYDLHIADDFDPALFCAITMVLDNCLHNGDNNRLIGT